MYETYYIVMRLRQGPGLVLSSRLGPRSEGPSIKFVNQRGGLRPTVMSKNSTDGPLKPRPEEYGLSAEQAARFERQPAYWREEHPLLDLLLVLGAFFCAAVVTEQQPRLYFWPLLIACGTAAWLVGLGLRQVFRLWNHLVSLSDLRRKKMDRDYEKFLAFAAADQEHQARTAAEFSQRREELKELRRVEGKNLVGEKDEERRQEAWWRSLSGHEFEKQLYDLFKLRGYDVRLTGLHGADGGIDMVVKAGPKTIIVQCKAHRHYLSAGPVRELYGTLLHEREHRDVTEAWLISASGFFRGAKDFASGKPIRLLTIHDILAGKETYFL